ncbi:MAG: fumarate hydratase [Kiritimatiellae bacterium]|nr:fumarate hydratase [Kiritimatiellia bacterium]
MAFRFVDSRLRRKVTPSVLKKAVALATEKGYLRKNTIDLSLGAGRDMAGVRRCILDAVQKAQGYGCAPGILGECIGGDRATGYEIAKEQLLRSLDEKKTGAAELRRLETRILKEANSLGIEAKKKDFLRKR